MNSSVGNKIGSDKEFKILLFVCI